MRKVGAVILIFVLLFTACNKEAPVIPPLQPDQTEPTLDFPFASFASTTQFIPFGDTLSGVNINRGYRVQFSDTNEVLIAACSGVVTAITPDTSGGNFIAVRFRPGAVYSFLYGGVTNVRVHIADSLYGGSILGKVSGTGIAYFQLTKNSNEALCPQAYGSPGFNTAIAGAISKNNAFHPTDTVSSPCMIQSLPY